MNPNTLPLTAIFLSVLTIISWILWSLDNRKRWLYMIMPISVAVNAILFYTVVLSHFPASVYNNTNFMYSWGDAVVVHGALSNLTSILVMIVVYLVKKAEQKYG